ncbi:hypothetical protein LCGC14_0729750 [marine sediment metagenome]|uniref:Uncharacterized protein n=1 Tax=marine sediment metagenome TaxID=412755 RepID=A0A0F9QE22_9ZZZZ
MVLKSTRLIQLKKSKRRKMPRRRTATGDLIIGGVGALIGVALLSEVAGLIN